MAFAETAKLIAELELKNSLGPGVAAANRQLSGLERSIGKIGSAGSRGLGKAVSNIEKIGFVAGTAVVGGLGKAVTIAGDFEAQLNTINTVAQVTPAELTKIGDGIRQIARDTGDSTDDLTSAYYDLVSAGISVADAQNVLKNASTLAIGALGTTSETVDLLTTALNSYNLTGKDSAHVADMFAQSVAAGKTTVSQIAASFAQVGSIAATAGVGLDELAAGYAQLTLKGIPAAEAATDMRAAIIALIKPNSQMLELQKKTKINFADVASEKGLAVAYDEIRAAAEKYGFSIPKLLGRVEAFNYLVNVTGDNAGQYADQLAKVQHASDGVGVAQDQAAERMKGFNFAIDRLKALGKDAAITIGSALLPQITDLVQELNTELVKPANQQKIKDFARDLANGLRDAVSYLKTVDWSSIAHSLQDAAGFGKTLLDAFVNAPDWVKTAVVTGWGLNKLTGGAVADIFSIAATGLIKGVLGMTAAVVNINAGVVNGAGGLPGAAGGAAGGIGSRLGNLAFNYGALGTVVGAVTLAADQVGRLPTLLEGFQEASSIKTSQDAQKAWGDLMAGSTMLTAFQPVIDKMLVAIGAGAVLPGKTTESLGGAAGPTTVVPGPGFTEWMHAQATGDSQMVATLRETEHTFAQRWHELYQQLRANGEEGPKLRRDLAQGLGITIDELVQLRHVARSEIAAQLGISVGEFIKLRRQSAGDDALLAAKLGISVDELATIRAKAGATASNTREIAGKDFSPTIKVDTTVRSSFSVSARTVATEVQRYSWTGRKRAE